MSKLIAIQTRRYSEFFRRLFAEYSAGVSIEVGNRRLTSYDIPSLLIDWCINAEICRTWHFRLLRGDIELFSFDDHPDHLFAALSERPFVERLRAERILRYRVLEEHKHEPFRLFGWLRRLFAA